MDIPRCRLSRPPALPPPAVPAFQPLPSTLVQLALTLGLVIASFALRVNSLVPVITYHALWDMVQFLGGLWGAEFGPLIPLGILVNVIAGAALWWWVLRKRSEGENSRETPSHRLAGIRDSDRQVG